jgi:modification methylase
MHDVCWYPARFVPAVPAHLIDAFSAPNDLICDPFCGSGTTLVEAALLGRKAWVSM